MVYHTKNTKNKNRQKKPPKTSVGNYKHTLKKWKNKKPQYRSKRYKGEPSENFKIENYNFLKVQRTDSGKSSVSGRREETERMSELEEGKNKLLSVNTERI